MINRLEKIDEIRGITLISMILYHFIWDLKNVSGIKMEWYEALPGLIWQQSICITFIFVSGFCFNLGKHHIKRSIIVFLSGALITAVTLIFTPQDRVIFGVLTFIGSAGFIMILIEKVHIKLERTLNKYTLNLTMMLGSLLMFIVFYRINYRILILFYKTIELPIYMFKGYFATYIGFCDPKFFSADYFSIIPWIFLYMAGYYLYRVLEGRDKLKIFYKNKKEEVQIDNNKLNSTPSDNKSSWLSFVGRHTLIIYLAHQPVLFGIAYMIAYIRH